MRRRTEKVCPTVGFQHHGYFVGFFNVPVQAPTRGQIYGYSGKPPHLVAFYDTLGIRRTYSRLNPRVPTGVDQCRYFINVLTICISYTWLKCTTTDWGAAVAEWLSSWLAEQEDRGSIPGLATWIFRDWLSPASKSRYGRLNDPVPRIRGTGSFSLEIWLKDR